MSNLFKQPTSIYWWATHSINGRRFRRSMNTTSKREAQQRLRDWAKELEAGHGESRDRGGIPSVHQAIAMYLESCARDGLAPTTTKDYRQRLAKWATFVGGDGPANWSEERAIALVADYVEHRAASGIVKPGKDRIVISGWFNYLRHRRWYRGQNPADSKLHRQVRPRRKLKQETAPTFEEDIALRKHGQRSRVWPFILLVRWAGLRRAEVAGLKWADVDLDRGAITVTGETTGRKHPRKFRISEWVRLQVRLIKPQWDAAGDLAVWTHHVDTSNDWLAEFCTAQGLRSMGYTELRHGFVTECRRNGMRAADESAIAGHSIEIAERHYNEYGGEAGHEYLPRDPLTNDPRKREEGTA